MVSGLVIGAYSTASSSSTSLVELCATQEECSKSHCLGLAVYAPLTSPLANRAPKSAALFVSIVIQAPICQVLVMLSGAALLALEWPLPALKQLSIHRAMILRPVMLLFQAFFAILFYQVRVAPCGWYCSSMLTYPLLGHKLCAVLVHSGLCIW